MTDVLEFVKSTISNICGLDATKIADHELIGSGLGIDSVDFLDVIYEVDRHYGIKVPIEQWMSRVTNREAKEEEYFQLGNLCNHIRALVVAKGN